MSQPNPCHRCGKLQEVGAGLCDCAEKPQEDVTKKILNEMFHSLNTRITKLEAEIKELKKQPEEKCNSCAKYPWLTREQLMECYACGQSENAVFYIAKK